MTNNPGAAAHIRYADAAKQLAGLRRQIADIRQSMHAVRASVEPEAVDDYAFATTAGALRLSDLFGDKDTLFVVHNMGAGCVNCTMWADGFNGVYEHLRSRAAFVVSSPDSPQRQVQFAARRGWRFPMISHAGSSFAEDMGYKRDGRCLPGLSVFKRRDAAIMRVADTAFDESDDFCSVWRLFDLIPEGAGGWRAQITYDEQAY